MADNPIETDEPAVVDTTARRVAALAAAVADGDGALIAHAVEDAHPADAADAFEQLSRDQFRQAVRLAPGAFTPDVLAELADEVRADALDALPAAAIAEAVTVLDSDDATLVLDELAEDRRAEVLGAVSDADRRAVEEGLSFDDETAGRLMQREVVAAPEHWTLGQIIDHLRAQGEDGLPENFFEIYVVDPAFRPVAALPIATFFKHPREARASDVAAPLQVIIQPETDQEDVAYAFSQYHLAQAPVVDDAGRLTGMLTVDDIVEVIQDENAEDLLALAGVSEAGVGDTVWRSVGARAPWLLVNLLTAVLASAVIAQFEDALAALVALAVLMPIVASMGGNAGTQTLTVAVRALAQRDLTAANARRIIWRETMTGAINGIIFAAVMALVAGVWFGDARLAGVIAAAMVINLVCAGVSGIAIPLALKRAGADPAVSSTVFLTTVTDVVGFFAFLGLASLVLL